MANKRCSSCKNFVQDEGLSCAFFCGRIFHKICARVSEDLHKEIAKEKSNIFFRCSDCANINLRHMFTKISELVSAADVLTKKMSAFDSLQADVRELITVVGLQRRNDQTCIIHTQEEREIETGAEKCVSSFHSGTSQSNVHFQAKNAGHVTDAVHVGSCVGATEELAGEFNLLSENRSPPAAINTDAERTQKHSVVDYMVDGVGMVTCEGVVEAGLAADANVEKVNLLDQQETVNIAAKRMLKQNENAFLRLCGEDVAGDLNVVVAHKWFHVSKFDAETSEVSIIKYVARKIGVAESSIKCFKLVKKDATNLKFVNFKVGIPANYLKSALNASNWPQNTIIREFIQKNDKAKTVQALAKKIGDSPM